MNEGGKPLPFYDAKGTIHIHVPLAQLYRLWLGDEILLSIFNFWWTLTKTKKTIFNFDPIILIFSLHWRLTCFPFGILIPFMPLI